MNARPRSRWWIRLAVVLVAGVAFLVWAVRQRTQNALVVENRSGQPIAELRITVGGETLSLTDVPSGAERTAPFPIKSDDSFAVEGRLADGTVIRGRFGYVTGGMYGERARFVVLPGGEIKFHQGDRARQGP